MVTKTGFKRPRLGPPLASGYRSEESDWLRRCKSLWGRLMAWQGDMSHNVMGSNSNGRKRYFYLKLGPVWTHLSWFRPACCGWCWGIPDAWCQLGVPWRIMIIWHSQFIKRGPEVTEATTASIVLGKGKCIESIYQYNNAALIGHLACI